MTLYLVTVIVGGERKQYFDSIWVGTENAQERAKQLRAEFRRVGLELLGPGEWTNATGSAWAVTITVANCTDGQVLDPVQPGEAIPLNTMESL